MELDKRRVVVTGLGVLAPNGNNLSTFFSNLVEGVDGVGEVKSFDVSGYRFKTAGEVKDLNNVASGQGINLERVDRGTALLLLAAKDALSHSGLCVSNMDESRIGLVTGTTLGGMVSGEKFYRRLYSGQRKIKPALLIYASQNAANDCVMARLGFRGQSVVLSTACSASTHAIGYARDMIRSGIADVVLAGGFDPMSELTFSGFGILRALTTDKIRPFDANRSGLVLGEGAGVLVLESLQNARGRGARIYAEIAGYGSSSDAYHMTGPHPEGAGAVRAMTMALTDAGVATNDVDYVNAHGTATRANDVTETKAIQKALGEHAGSVSISSIKSMIGHLLGAAGAVEAIATILTLVNGVVPPTINYVDKDPECNLDYTPNTARERKVKVAMSNSFGFGGNNSVIVFRPV